MAKLQALVADVTRFADFWVRRSRGCARVLNQGAGSFGAGGMYLGRAGRVRTASHRVSAATYAIS